MLQSSMMRKTPSAKAQKPTFGASRTTMDEKYIEQAWDFLQKAIWNILRKRSDCLSFEELYRRGYEMVLHKDGQRLYDGVRKIIEEHTSATRNAVENAENGNVLSEIINIWKEHVVAMGMIRDVLMYVDRTYVAQNKIPPIYDLGLNVFKEYVICYNGINDRTTRELLEMVQAERDGQLIDWLLLKKICEMLVDIDEYVPCFETPFLKETAKYYKKIGMELLLTCNATEFVDRAEKFVEDEGIRAQRSYGCDTKAKLLKTIDEELIKEHIVTIVNKEGSGVTYLLQEHSQHNDDAKRIAQLNKIYVVLNRVAGGHATLCKAVSDWIRQRGEHISLPSQNDDGKNVPLALITSLIDLKKQSDDLITKAFCGDSIFKNRIYAEFEYFINKNEDSAEFLAIYLDDKLKKGLRVLSDAELEQSLNGAMELFRFIANKDTFEHYYKRQLARRLLTERSVSDDVEKRMVNRLKTECGYQYTQKLELMFKDRELWPTLHEGFRAHHNIAPQRMVDMQVRVLTSGVWPTQTSCTHCYLPDKAMTSFLAFNDFYTTRHNGRRLSLNTFLGAAEVKAIFYNPLNNDASQLETHSIELPPYPSGTRVEAQKILSVSTHQMAVLMLFNLKDLYTFDEIAAATNIPELELTKVLQSLSMGKTKQRILMRKTKQSSNTSITGKIADDDVFYVNDYFTSKLTRIKIFTIAEIRKNQQGAGPSNEDREKIKEQTNEDRKHEIECAIVRVMKARKSLVHNNLVAEVIVQLSVRFKPAPTLIKQRIEALMEREYLVRDKNEECIYHYVA